MLVCAGWCRIMIATADSRVQKIVWEGRGMTYFLVYCMLTVTLFLSFS